MEDKIMKIGKWKGITVCIKCKTEINRFEEMHSNGVCPYCGHSNDSTILDTEIIVKRYCLTYMPKW